MELRIFVEPQEGATYEQQLALARRPRRTASARSSAPTICCGSNPAPEPGPTDSWVTLGAIARETSTIRLGTMVTSATFRLPGPLAVAVAQVDAMSGGRVELGLGTAGSSPSTSPTASPSRRCGERFERLEEQLQILTGLWSTPAGESYEFAGEHYTFGPGPALPKPLQRPHPPVISAASARVERPRWPRASRRSSTSRSPMSRHGRGALRERPRGLRAAQARSGELVYSHAVTVCCAEDGAGLRRRAERIGQDVEDLRRSGAAGTPQEVVERLSE